MWYNVLGMKVPGVVKFSEPGAMAEAFADPELETFQASLARGAGSSLW